MSRAQDLCPPLFRDKGDTARAQKVSQVETQEIMPGAVSLAFPKRLHFKIHPGSRVSVHPGEGPRVVSVEQRNWIISLKENKDLEEMPHVNDLTISFLCSSSLGGTPTPSLSFYLNKPLLHVLSPLVILFMSQKIIPEFTCVSISVINTLFTVGKDPGKMASSF